VPAKTETIMPIRLKQIVFLFFISGVFFAMPQAGFSNTLVVSTVKELMATVPLNKKGNLTVLVEDGVYEIPHRIEISGDRVTYKGISQNPGAVVIKGKGHAGNVDNVFSINGSHVYIQNLKIGQVKRHAVQIHGENKVEKVFISNVHFFDTGEQMLKGSFDKNRPDHFIRSAMVENCVFEFTGGNAFQSYTGGIDVHHGENWVVKNNVFKNITNPGGKLTEGAVHFWNHSKNIIVIGNKIIHCDRGILFGMDNSPVYSGRIADNLIHTTKDTGIYLCNATDIEVLNNTIYIDSTYPNAIEYRFEKTKDVVIAGNFANRAIRSRDGGSARVFNNDLSVKNSWYIKPSQAESPPVEIPSAPPKKSEPVHEPVTEAFQVENLRAWHTDGQTFLTFHMVKNDFPDADITYGQYFERKKQIKNNVQYHIYRSNTPFKDVRQLIPLARVDGFTGWNEFFYGIHTNAEKYSGRKAIRYTVKPKEGPLAQDKGLFVYAPEQKGSFYYAVTAVTGGRENKEILIGQNVTQNPVQENTGPGTPILQRVESPKEFQYIKNPTLYFFTRWETFPNAGMNAHPFDYLVAVPENVKNPAPVGIHLHSWGGNLLEGYAWWNNAEKGAILLASNQYPYDWWTGYHEHLFSKNSPKSNKEWQHGVVRPFTINRLFSFLAFIDKDSQWKVDLSRTFVAGSSMGGSGSVMLAIRYPEKIAWARSWVGVHIPEESPQFKGSYAKVWGSPEFKVKFEDGTPVWDYYNNAKYLYAHPEKEMGFITFANGKNDNQIGWGQAVKFFKALQETKQPHLFVWGQGGHGQRTVMPGNNSERVMPLDIRTDQLLPAFTRCSLDNDPGNGDPGNGDPAGQANQWLYWEDPTLVDTVDRLEMTVALMDKAPAQVCTVDITPRRIQQFHVMPGTVLYWKNIDIHGHVIQNGQIIADAHGVITLEKITVSRQKNKLVISKNPV
jgi:hypothetical protein